MRPDQWTAAPNRWWDCDVSGCYRDAAPDWTPFNGCFAPTRIRISDVDGMVERKGHVLFIEAKQGRMKLNRQYGQDLALRTLVNQGHVVMWLYGHRNEYSAVDIWTTAGDTGRTPIDTNAARELIAGWFQAVEADRLADWQMQTLRWASSKRRAA